MELTNEGDTKLYNELVLRIIYMNEIVFHGELEDYDGVMDCPLASMTEEGINFDLKFF